MEFAEAVQAYWEQEKDAIVCPDGMNPNEFFPDKKRFDPRKWIVKGEDRMREAIEGLVDISGSAGKSILL